MEIQGLAHYKQQFQLQSEPVITPGLERVEAALHKLGNPHHQLHIIHVAGTNGKGSTTAFLEQLAIARNLKVGTFTSPAFVDVHDQIRLNGQAVTAAQFSQAMQQIAQADIQNLTDFELLTVVAFVVLANANVEMAIIEAGMGGLLDATNVVKPVVTVITTIALEHTQFLGTTITDIAAHKAGIIKFGAPVVVGALPQEALAIMTATAQQKNVPLFVYGEDFTWHRGTYQLGNQRIERVVPSLKGAHQEHNMAVALTAFIQFSALLKLHVAPKRIQRAVQQVTIPYRFEQYRQHVYVDGAHNVAGAQALVETIERTFPQQRVHIVIGMLKDKDVAGVLRVLQPVAQSFSFISFEHERALAAEQFLQYAEGHIVTSIDEALANVADEPVVITGSLYLLAQVL